MSYISLGLNTLISAVKKAGNTLTRDFNEIEQLQTSVRGHLEFSKAAEERVSKILRAELQKHHPDYTFADNKDKLPKGNFFVINALDGKLNFMHGIPYFSVSAAIVENNQVVAAVIYNPATSDLYFAEKGRGAFKEGYRNHERLRVSGRKDLKNALIGVKNCDSAIEVAGLRNNGALSLDMAMLASGKLDGLFCQDNRLSEYAAGLLLVKEAGGYTYEYNQQDIRTDNQSAVLESGNIIAGNAELAPKLYKALHI